MKNIERKRLNHLFIPIATIPIIKAIRHNANITGNQEDEISFSKPNPVGPKEART